jgi:hypothetical protein
MLDLVGILTTVPVALVLGFLIADPFYMHFIFEGDRRDFTPGDSLGVLFWACIFTAVIMIPAMIAWLRLYSRVSSREMPKGQLDATP